MPIRNEKLARLVSPEEAATAGKGLRVEAWLNEDRGTVPWIRKLAMIWLGGHRIGLLLASSVDQDLEASQGAVVGPHRYFRISRHSKNTELPGATRRKPDCCMSLT
jgi:hypothetical protein